MRTVFLTKGDESKIAIESNGKCYLFGEDQQLKFVDWEVVEGTPTEVGECKVESFAEALCTTVHEIILETEKSDETKVVAGYKLQIFYGDFDEAGTFSLAGMCEQILGCTREAGMSNPLLDMLQAMGGGM